MTKTPEQERHDLELNAALLKAEQTVANGPMAGPILHLRRRGRAARTSALIFLGGLIVTVLFGLVFYLGLPFWKQYVDGTRSTLEASLASIEADIDALDVARQGLIDGNANPNGLVGVLKGAAVVIPSGTVADLKGSIVDGQTTLIYGDGRGIAQFSIFDTGFVLLPYYSDAGLHGESHNRMIVPTFVDNDGVTRSTDGGASFTAIQSSTYGIVGGVVDGTTILLYGDGGTITRSTDGGANFTPIQSVTNADLYGGVYSSGDERQTVLLYGEDGTIIRSTDGAASFNVVRSNTTAKLYGSVEKNQMILLYGANGAIIRSTDGGASFVAIQSSTAASLYGSVNDGQIVLLYGANGTILRSTDGGASFAAIQSGTDSHLTDSLINGQTILLYGWYGAITRSTDGGASFNAIQDNRYVNLLGGVHESESILLYGESGEIIRSTDGGASFSAVQSGTDAVLVGSTFDDQTIVIYGTDGTIIRSTDGGAIFTAIPSGIDTVLRGSAGGERDVLIYGDDGAIIRLSDDLSTKAAELVLPKGAEGDLVLRAFFEAVLPEHIRNFEPVQKLRQALVDIQTRRAVLTLMHSETKDELDDINGFPHSLLLLEKQREDFASFMAICRGGPEPTPPQTGTTEDSVSDPMTLACLAGWRDTQQSETQSWWQTVASQVPPGILLLFLLSTLAALYRYNLRLAGFHHSRADALELMALGKRKDEIQQLIDIANVLAADKVVFDKSDDATKQAVDLIKAVRGSV